MNPKKLTRVWQAVHPGAAVVDGAIRIDRGQYTSAKEAARSPHVGMKYKPSSGSEARYEHQTSRGLAIYFNDSESTIRIEATRDNDLESLTAKLRLPRGKSAEF